ncbi:MAG TPA: adenylyltransferase/cytidyltransferase family protein [Candidatus Peribacteria bacterium]|nr:adenylyltransferase/cytidyltransferase family protein [Candidatus Peribacteria bacterium]
MKVMIFGTFDKFHPGHEFVLREALKRGDVTVIVARDANVERIKGKAPRYDERVRVAAIKTAFPAANVRLGDDADFLSPVRKFAPDLILLGYDQRLPPGVSDADLPCAVERLPAFEPQKYKSSLLDN